MNPQLHCVCSILKPHGILLGLPRRFASEVPLFVFFCENLQILQPEPEIAITLKHLKVDT